MVVSPQLSPEECEGILGHFGNSAYISILVPDETDSQKYEVEYKIQGAVRQEDGSVVICRGHKISISIPFGYPNLPPNCKPLSAIFHPDFDPDAICINNFWQESPSLTGLVVHIGLMICGREFSTENTFNPEAAAWYKANSEKLPFDTVDLQTLNTDEVVSEESAVSGDLSAETGLRESYEDLADQYEADLSRSKKRKKVLAITFLVGIVTLAVGYFLMMDVQNYKSSLAKWHESGALLLGKRYQELESNGKDILARLEQIKFIHKNDGDKLASDIRQQLSSPEVQAALAGKIMFEGHYLPKKTVVAINDVRKFIAEGDAAFLNKMWSDASMFYKKAKDLLELHKGIEAKVVAPLELTFARAEVNKYFQAGERLLVEKNVDGAVASFQKAAEIANSIKIGAKKIAEIHAALDMALLEKFVLEGEGSFTSIELDKALESFNKALLLAEKESVTDPEYAAKIRRSIGQVNLYTLLAKGKDAYESGEWLVAQDAFQGALQLLSHGRLSDTDKQINEAAIRKKILQTKVKRLDLLSSQSMRQKNFAKALGYEVEIVKTINSSGLKERDDFNEKLLEATAEITYIGGLIDREEKIQYLTKNYQKIFRDNHSLARSANLSSPGISFVAEKGAIQAFKLKCIALTATGKIALELNYQYDRQKKIWRIGRLPK